jgi:Ca2+-transporting ATPase
MGTVVTKGTGVMKCVATGKQTQMGKVSRLLQEIDEEQTPLQKKLGELGKVLAVICLGVCVLVFLAGVLRGEPVLDMVMTGITIAIAAIPFSMLMGTGWPNSMLVTVSRGDTKSNVISPFSIRMFSA